MVRALISRYQLLSVSIIDRLRSRHTPQHMPNCQGSTINAIIIVALRFVGFSFTLVIFISHCLAPTILDPVTEYLPSCYILHNLSKFQDSIINRKCVTDLVALAFYGFLSVPITCYQSPSPNICGPFTS